MRNRRLRFGSRAQRAAATAVRERDDAAAILRLNGRLVDFVRRAFAEVEGDVFHWDILLSWVCRHQAGSGTTRARRIGLGSGRAEFVANDLIFCPQIFNATPVQMRAVPVPASTAPVPATMKRRARVAPRRKLAEDEMGFCMSVISFR
jgi:hypothetical protein